MTLQGLQIPVIYFINSFVFFLNMQTFPLDVLKSRHGHIYTQSVYWKTGNFLEGTKCSVRVCESWANTPLLVGTAGAVISTPTAAELEFGLMQTCCSDPRLSLNWRKCASSLLGYLCSPPYVLLPNHVIPVHSDNGWDLRLTETLGICA